MDLPIDVNELRDIIIALQKDEKIELADKLKLVEELMVDGKPYKKILREKHGIVA
jgi:hypothetical protein